LLKGVESSSRSSPKVICALTVEGISTEGEMPISAACFDFVEVGSWMDIPEK
jgi:hypothetical protein